MDKQTELDCGTFKELLKKKGDELDNFILSRNKAQRQVLREAYKACYGVELEKDISKALSGHYQDLVLALFQRPAEFDANWAHKAMKGLGTDDDTLIEILCTRSPAQLTAIKEEFPKLFKGDSLEKWVSSDTTGAYKKLLISLIQCNRSTNPTPNEEQCKSLAQELYNAGEAKRGTDEDVFNKIFTNCSPCELICINNNYNTISPRTLRHAIDKEYSGHIKLALQTILDGILNPAEYFAEKIKKSVKGIGTKDKMLIRLLVSREGIDMPLIRTAYKAKFGTDLLQDIKSDTSGEYQKLLLGIASGP